jgi:phosphoglycerate kinase
LTAIVGGAKISDKVLVIGNLIEKSDTIIICGGMAYTFLKTCFGMDIGKSLYDENGAKLAPGLLEKAKEKGCEIVLPCDWACGQDFVVSACVPYCIVLYCIVLYCIRRQIDHTSKAK